MASSEPWGVGDAIPNFEPNPATTTVLTATINSLTVAKTMIEIIPVKEAFESLIIILTLVRVRGPVPSHFSPRSLVS